MHLCSIMKGGVSVSPYSSQALMDSEGMAPLIVLVVLSPEYLRHTYDLGSLHETHSPHGYACGEGVGHTSSVFQATEQRLEQGMSNWMMVQIWTGEGW